MSFEEIINMMENATDYMDLYDAASYIVDDSLRVDVEQLIEQCEIDGDDVEVAYSIVTSDLLDIRRYELNESVSKQEIDINKETIKDYISDIQEASNDKDLLNILDSLDKNKNIDNNIVTSIRQLFRNNRYMPLADKITRIIKFINDLDNSNVKQESLTEDVNINNENLQDNESKENKNIDEIKDAEIESEESEDKSLFDLLQDRIGQQFSVGEFNSIIQSLFSQYNKVFLMTSDLYNMNLDETQTIRVKDDDDTYIIGFDIIDMDSGIIEITDVNME